MPFTPYHMGPGMLIKAALRGGFSLSIFGWTQILIDLQPLVALLGGTGRLHGFSHTYLGATLIAVVAAATGKPLLDLSLRLASAGAHGLRTPTWPVALVSGLIGAYSHVALDSIMHVDVEAFFPFSPANPLLRVISVAALHKLCIYSGLIGLALYIVATFILRPRPQITQKNIASK